MTNELSNKHFGSEFAARLTRGIAVGSLVLVLCAACDGNEPKPSFPSKPVTLIVPWQAGGTSDIVMRALAASAQKYLGQMIIIVNTPGASGTLAPKQMASTANPDGYVVAQIPPSALQSSFGKELFVAPDDLSFIIGISSYTFGIAVRQDAPWKTLADLLADARQRPGRITYASSGIQTIAHQSMLRVSKIAQIDVIHVPFRSSAESTNAVLAGHVDFLIDGTSWGPMVNAGALRLLATLGEHRTKNWPDIPTLLELGIDVVTHANYGIAGPKGIPGDRIKILHDAFKAGMEDPEFLATLDRLEQEPNYMSSETYRKYAVTHASGLKSAELPAK